MTKLLTAGLIGSVAAFVLGVQPASADAINIVYFTQVCATASATSGGVSDSHGGCVSDPTGQGASAITPFASSTAGADLLTYNLGPSAFRALVSSEASALTNAQVSNAQSSGQASSSFSLSFDIILPHAYEYVANLALLGALTNGTPSGGVTFTGPGINFSTFGGPSAGLGILMPGSYLITAYSQSNASTSSGGAFSSTASSIGSFDLHMGAIPDGSGGGGGGGGTPSTVPEPTSMVLLGTGIIGAYARRRRTRLKVN